MQDLHRHLPGDVDQATAAALIDELAADPAVSGILLQLPTPKHLDSDALIARIPAEKDVDGLTTANAGLLAQGRPGLRPCTPAGVMTLLDEYDVPLSGAEAVVVGRSVLVGKPMAQLLLGAERDGDRSATRARATSPRSAGAPTCWSSPPASPGSSARTRSSPGRPSSTSASTAARTDCAGTSSSTRSPRWPGAITPVPGGVGPDDDRDAAGQHPHRGDGPAGRRGLMARAVGTVRRPPRRGGAAAAHRRPGS